MVNELRFSTSTFAVAIEHDAARRPQRDGALMIVLGELLELLVLHDLEVPEAERENREDDGKAHLQHHEPNGDAPTIFDGCREFRHRYPISTPNPAAG